MYADVLDGQNLNSIVVNYNIDWIIHFSALLSAVGEKNFRRALQVQKTLSHTHIDMIICYVWIVVLKVIPNLTVFGRIRVINIPGHCQVNLALLTPSSLPKISRYYL